MLMAATGGVPDWFTTTTGELTTGGGVCAPASSRPMAGGAGVRINSRPCIVLLRVRAIASSLAQAVDPLARKGGPPDLARHAVDRDAVDPVLVLNPRHERRRRQLDHLAAVGRQIDEAGEPAGLGGLDLSEPDVAGRVVVEVLRLVAGELSIGRHPHVDAGILLRLRIERRARLLLQHRFVEATDAGKEVHREDRIAVRRYLHVPGQLSV